MLRQHRDLEAEVKTDVSGSVRIVVLDWVVLELERLARKGPARTRTWANTALTLLKQRNYPIVEHRPGPADVDASLVQFALTEKLPTAIATIDKQLRTVLDVFSIATIRPKAKYGLMTSNLRS